MKLNVRASPQPGVFTSGGQLIFNDGQTPGIFTATVGAPIPEPTTMLLFASGLAIRLKTSSTQIYDPQIPGGFKLLTFRMRQGYVTRWKFLINLRDLLAPI